MKVVTLEDVMDAGRDVYCPKGGFVSYRYLLAGDGMGFSLHKTMIPRGDVQRWHYKRHQEACFCVSGLGVLTSEATGRQFYIRPDSCYVLDNHDPHTFRALTDVVLISVFNPPVVGNEVHGEDGSYE
jgi:L-ectoine synthase